MAINEMTSERRKAIVEIIRWYWASIDVANTIDVGVLHKSDYEFLYDLWEHGLSFYDTDVQTRLNEIRDIYIQNHPDKQKTFRL